MPFKSEAQRRLCWVMYNKDIKEGHIPKWDCHAWAAETKKLNEKEKNKKRKRVKKRSLVTL